MGLLSLFEILTMYTQFLSVSFSTKIRWPESWVYYRGLLEVASLNFQEVIPAFDARTNYLFITSVIPLLMSFVLLYLFRRLAFAVWFLFLQIGILTGSMGWGFYILVRKEPISLGFGILGTVLVGILLIALLAKNHLMSTIEQIKIVYNKYAHPDKVSDSQFEVIKDTYEAVPMEAECKPTRALIRNVVVAIFFIVAASLFFTMIKVRGKSSASTKLQSIVAPILYFIAFCFLLNVQLNLFPKGVTFLTKLNIYFRKNTLKVLQILLGLMYIPITTSIMSMFMCKTVSCPAGTRIFKYLSNLDIFEMMSPKPIQDTCVACIFENSCPAALKQDFCPGASESLLIKDLTLSCTNEIYQFFYLPMILLLLIATIGIPILYFKIVNVISKILKTLPVTADNEDKSWEERTKLSNNSSKTMYNAFESKWKYYKIVLIFYRLLVVLSFTFFETLNLNSNASIALCIVHTMAFVFSMISRPYIEDEEDQTFIAGIILNLANAIIVACGSFDPNNVPKWLVYPMAVLNAVVPAAILAYAGYKKKHAQIHPVDDQKDQVESVPAANKINTFPNKFKSIRSKTFRSSVSKTDVEGAGALSHTKETLKTLDTSIERSILTLVVNYFLAFGVIATITMSLGSIGMYTERSAYKMDPDTRLDKNDPQAWFVTWDEFTSNCCCSMSDSTFNTTGNSVIEVWQCRNKPFVYKVHCI